MAQDVAVQTYSQPKLIGALETVIAFPSSGFVTEMLFVAGIVTSSLRVLLGTGKGRV